MNQFGKKETGVDWRTEMYMIDGSSRLRIAKINSIGQEHLAKTNRLAKKISPQPLFAV